MFWPALCSWRWLVSQKAQWLPTSDSLSASSRSRSCLHFQLLICCFHAASASHLTPQTRTHQELRHLWKAFMGMRRMQQPRCCAPECVSVCHPWAAKLSAQTKLAFCSAGIGETQEPFLDSASASPTKADDQKSHIWLLCDMLRAQLVTVAGILFWSSRVKAATAACKM